jgi:hypothetical protein
MPSLATPPTRRGASLALASALPFLLLTACAATPAPAPASNEPAPATSAHASPTGAPPAPPALSASAPLAAGGPAPADATPLVELARLGASLRPPRSATVNDGDKDAELRGPGFVIKLHLEAERPKLLTAADARRQVALRDAAEFGLRGLVAGASDADDDSGPHKNVEAAEIAPREFVLVDEAAQHVHVYVWRRRPAGGWIWADCRAEAKEELATIRRACLTLALRP